MAGDDVRERYAEAIEGCGPVPWLAGHIADAVLAVRDEEMESAWRRDELAARAVRAAEARLAELEARLELAEGRANAGWGLPDEYEELLADLQAVLDGEGQARTGVCQVCGQTAPLDPQTGGTLVGEHPVPDGDGRPGFCRGGGIEPKEAP